jgi:ribosomal protein L44E
VMGEYCKYCRQWESVYVRKAGRNQDLEMCCAGTIKWLSLLRCVG